MTTAEQREFNELLTAKLTEWQNSAMFAAAVQQVSSTNVPQPVPAEITLPPASPRDFLETPKVVQIRVKPGAVIDEEFQAAPCFQIFLPDGKTFATRNGVTIQIDSADLDAGTGPWYDLLLVDGTAEGIYAVAVPNASSAAWVVNPPTECKIKFYGSATAAATASPFAEAAELYWPLATIDADRFITQQLVTGKQHSAMSMGDADAAEMLYGGAAVSPPNTSIRSKADKSFEVANISASTVQADAVVVVVGRKTVTGAVQTWPMQVKDSATTYVTPTTGGFKIDVNTDSIGEEACPTNPTVATLESTSSNTSADEPEGNEASATDTWTACAAEGVAFWVTTRVGYFDATSRVLYGYKRKMIFTKKGKLYSISGELRYIIDSPEPI